MKNKITATAVVLTTAILAGGCGAEAEATSTDISPTEPVTQTTTEAEEMETESIESEETEESIIEDTSIDESEAKEMLKAYEDKIAEADVEGYYDEIVYAFTTNFNDGKTEEEAFNLALQHAKELKAFDEEVAQAEKAKHDAEAREAEANKLAKEQQAKEETPTANGSTGTDASVPVTKEVAQEQQAQQTVEQPQPTPAPTTPAPTTPQKTPEEIQAECDRINEEISKITNPDDPSYGVHYMPDSGLVPDSQFR